MEAVYHDCENFIHHLSGDSIVNLKVSNVVLRRVIFFICILYKQNKLQGYGNAYLKVVKMQKIKPLYVFLDTHFVRMDQKYLIHLSKH